LQERGVESERRDVFWKLLFAVLVLKQAHLLAPWLAREFFLILAAEFSSPRIKTCPARRRFIAAWRFLVVPAVLDHFLVVRKHTASAVDYL